jgi:hypothetical protein
LHALKNKKTANMKWYKEFFLRHNEKKKKKRKRKAAEYVSLGRLKQVTKRTQKN